ncbi:hatching enzyme 1.2-like [Discoglossus pictus]
MAIRASLILLASLHCILGAPLKKSPEATNTDANVPVPPKEIFSMIIEANKGSTKLLRQADIAVQTSRSAMMCDGDSCRWNKNSNGIVNVPYIISKDYDSSEVSIILNAMQDFETLTCVNFIPRTVEADYLQIKSESGCWSYIGKTGRPQDLSLESGSCVKKGIIQHELNHVLGFYHEQSRSDRDDYIDIIAANIIPDAVKNFGKMATDNMDLDYDYSSVMHYGRYDFSKKPGFATIVPKPDPSVSIGQRYGLSNLDISKINKLYDCGTCSTLLPDSTGTLMSANYPKKYPSNVNCVWLIRAPYGQIFLEFSVFDVQSSSGCDSDYLKVYDGASRSSPVLLYRTCGTKQLPSLVSSTNVMLLEFVSGKGKKSTGFKASYTTVKCIKDSGSSVSVAVQKLIEDYLNLCMGWIRKND